MSRSKKTNKPKKLISKKNLMLLSRGAYLIIALTFCDMAQSIIGKVLVLVSIGVISGIQEFCIKNIDYPKVHEG